MYIPLKRPYQEILRYPAVIRLTRWGPVNGKDLSEIYLYFGTLDCGLSETGSWCTSQQYRNTEF